MHLETWYLGTGPVLSRRRIRVNARDSLTLELAMHSRRDEEIEILDHVTGERITVRRAACGLGCRCALELVPARSIERVSEILEDYATEIRALNASTDRYWEGSRYMEAIYGSRLWHYPLGSVKDPETARIVDRLAIRHARLAGLELEDGPTPLADELMPAPHKCAACGSPDHSYCGDRNMAL